MVRSAAVGEVGAAPRAGHAARVLDVPRRADPPTRRFGCDRAPSPRMLAAPSRKREGRRVARAPGVRAPAHDRWSSRPGPGHADVEEAPLLLDGLRGVGHRDRQEAVGAADEEHGVPLQALGGVERGQGDPLDRRRVLARGPLVELADEGRHPRLGVGAPRGRRRGRPGRQATPTARGPLPRWRGGSRVQPPPTRTSRTRSGRRTVPSSERAAPRMRTMASRTSVRLKNRSPPRTR